MNERPECQLKTSKWCSGKAIMVYVGKDGLAKYACSACHWLETNGEENKIYELNERRRNEK